MIHDAVSATYIKDYKIEIEFDNGRKGIVDFSSYLNKGGVFEHFKDIDFFRNFEVNQETGVLTWQNEIDIAPETLYSAATGEPLPSWMDAEDAA